MLQSCLEYAMNHHSKFLPGEGGYILHLLNEVGLYFSYLLFQDLVLFFVIEIYLIKGKKYNEMRL